MRASTSAQPYSERLLKRLVPFLALVIFVASIATIISITVNSVNQVYNTHKNALNRAEVALETYLEPLVNDAKDLAINPVLLNYIAGKADSREANTQARDFMTAYPDQVLAVRFIKADSRVGLEVLNVRGFSQITIETELALRSTNYRNDTDFIRALNTDLAGNVLIGQFKLQRDRRNGLILSPPRLFTTLYVPVLETANTVSGVIQVELDAQNLLNIINRAETRFIDALDGRHIVLASSNNLVVADSSAPTLQYIADLEQPGGNAPLTPLYQSLNPYLTAPRPEDSIAGHTASQIVSVQQATIPNVTGINWRIFVIDSLFSAYRGSIASVALIILVAITTGLLTASVLRWLVSQMLYPVEQAGRFVDELAQNQTPVASAIDANIPLVQSVLKVAKQIESMNENYETQVSRRNRDLRIVGRIGYETAISSNLDLILRRAINLICNEMGFYHAQVFLIDELDNSARLAYSRGEAGAEMIARNHKLAIGSPTVIGTTTAQRRPVIINDVSDPNNEVKHGFNPLLPETRAEMALPLIVGDTLIGALDIQAVNTNVFLPDDIPTFELLANQVAIAIYNAQLKAQTQRRVEQVDRLNRQLTRSAWEEASNALALSDTYGTPPTPAARDKRSVPITIRGESIGQIEAGLGDNEFTEGDQAILQAVAERVAIAIENARLFQETQVSLSETSALYRLSRQLNEANTLEDVLQAITMSVAPDSIGGQIWAFDDYVTGLLPETARLLINLSLSPRRQETPIPIGTSLHLPDFEFFQGLDGQHATFINDVKALGAPLDVAFALMGAQSIAVVPLNMRGAWKGFITIEFADRREFAERDQRMYDALVGQAGVAVDNRLLLQQTEDALTRNEKLYAASRLINTARNLQDLVYAAVATTSDPAQNFWLGLLEGDADVTGWRENVRIVAYSDSGNVYESDRVFPLALESNSPLRIREPEIITDTDPDEPATTPALKRLREAEQRFMAMFPLYIENLPIALFYIVSRRAYQLSPEDYDVYRALTGQMSTQIQNRRLFERTEAALQETTRLYVASRAISSAQDLTSLYETVAGHVAAPFAQTKTQNPVGITLSVLLARPQYVRTAPELEYVYQWSSDPAVQPAMRLGATMSQADVPLGFMLEQSDDDILVYSQLKNVENLALRSLLRQETAVAAAVIPLQVRQQWFGVMVVHTDKVELLNEDYIRFLRAVADQVAVAIQNQTLLQENIYERANLSKILSTLPAGVLVLDPDTFKPRQSNERIEELIGREIDYELPFTSETYNLYRTGTPNLYPNDQMPTYSAQRLNRAIFCDDMSVITPIGQTDLLVNAAPIYDSKGRATAIVVAFQDITNLRNLENTLQENLRETVALYETQRALSESDSLDGLLETIIGQLSVQPGSDAYVFLSDRETEDIQLVRYIAEPMQVDGDLRLLFQTEPFVLNDTNDPMMSDDLKQTLQARGIEACVVAPMRAKSRALPLGWIMVVHNQAMPALNDQERVLTTIADMASTAIDNTYLVQSTQVALQETAALYNAATTINRSRDMNELSEALQTALQNTGAEMVAAFLMTDTTVTTLFSEGFEESVANGLDLEKIARARIPQEEGMYVVDVTRQTLGTLEREVIRAGNIQSFAIVTLRVKDLAGGRLLVAYTEEHTFKEGEIRFLNTVADSASVVIDNMVLLDQIQSTLQETSVLYQASRALIEVNSAEDIVDVIVNYLIEPHITQVLVFMTNQARWDAPNAMAHAVAAWQFEDTGNTLEGAELTEEQFSAWRLLATDSVTLISNVNDPNSGLTDIERLTLLGLSTHSLVIIPLRVPSRVIGTIWLMGHEPHTYQDRDARVYQAFAEQSSLSLEASRLLAQTERRATQLQTTAQIAESVGQILDLDVLLPRVVNLIRSQFGYDHAQVFLMDDKDEWAVLRASTGESGRQLLSIGHRLKKGSRSVIGQVTQNAETTVALDTLDAKVIHYPNPYLPLTRSEMAIPLLIKGRVVGALDVQSNRPNAFTDEDIQALTTLAGQIAIAIDNARLYERAQNRVNDLAFLFDVTNSASVSDTLDDALQAVTERLYDALGALIVAIYLPQVYVDLKKNAKVTMKAETLMGIEMPLTEVSEVTVGDSENLIGIVASTLQSQMVSNIEREVRYFSIHPSAQSALIVPISTGAELIGLVVLEAEQVNAFSHDTMTLMLTLSGSLSAVIQNTLLVEKLQKSNEQLREIDRLKSQFLANMSHELRTPLNSIIGFSRVMLKGIDGPLTEMQEQDLTTIYNSGNHLLNLINDILDQAKIEANEMNLKYAYFEVKPMVESVKSIAIGLIKDKPLQLVVEVAPNLPQAYGDEFRSRQIMLNLVSNAIKFTPEGLVSIRVYAMQDAKGMTFIRADVIDTGIGIAEKDLPILFEQFRQVDSSLTRTVGGTGLGLPISKSLAELQGGHLIVASEVGVGSTFSVLIPTQSVSENERKQQKDTPEAKKPTGNDTVITHRNALAGEKPSLATTEMPAMPLKRDVLLIEDNKDMVDQYRRALQREGFEVQTADHPSYAEAMVGQLRPTVVVMDVNFANGQGWQILQNLKGRDDTSDVPIIITTLSSETDRALALGAYRVIQRPFMPDMLVKAVLQAEKEHTLERILIIDDQPESIRLLKQLLAEHGNYRVFEAESGKEGISLVARRRPSLIILDLRMPEMDGFAVLNELRSNPETASIPVMVVTGDTNLAEDESARLQNIRVVPKAGIGEESYNHFINDVKATLTNRNS